MEVGAVLLDADIRLVAVDGLFFFLLGLESLDRSPNVTSSKLLIWTVVLFRCGLWQRMGGAVWGLFL